MATADALIPLKAHAWLDLTARRAAGEMVDKADINKHRGDVFRLAASLPGELGPEFPELIRADLTRFLAAFPEDSDQWTGILASIKTTVGPMRAVALIDAIKIYFGLVR